MNIFDTPEYAILRLKDQIAGNKAVLAAYRLGPLSERGLQAYRFVEMQQAQLEEELRLLELSALDNKYDPNQPRVPAGNSDGGQWTDDGGSGAGVDPMTTGATSATANQGTGPWLRDAERLAGQSIRTNPAMRSAAALYESLKSPPIEYPLDQAVDQYNAIAATDDPYTIPIISVRARAFAKGDTDAKIWASVREADIAEVSKLCPHYFTVQTQTDIAAFAAGPVSDYKNPGAHGTGVHKILEHQINPAFNPELVAELVLLKPMEEALNRVYTKDPRRGEEDTVKLDIYERVSDELACIYDIKAGKKGLSPRRMSELADSVARRHPEIKWFFVIQIRPSPGANGEAGKR